MTRIAFCDDDAALLHQMQDFLEQYRTLRGVQLELAPYTKPMELLADIEAGVRFDVLFLDVLMPGINGINAAREIRRYDTAVQIIFVTSSSEFAVQSYVVGAYYYQLKPIWKDSFFRLTDAVLAECRKRTQHSLILRCKSGVTRITLDSLEYCEVQGRTLVFHLLDGAAVGIFGILLSAAFCPIRWTDKKRWALAGCTAGLLALQGVLYFGSSPTAAQYLYPLITHLPLYVVLVLFSGQKVWPLVAVLTAYLCCQVRRWAALAVALFLPQHPLVQPVAELLFTLPLLLLFIRFLAPSMRQLSHYPASVQCQFGIVPLVSYLFDYITHVYTNLLSEANPAAVEFMFFVCCAAFLCSILRASRVERQRIQMEQLQTSLNLQVTQAMREIEALRLSQQRASTYRHDLRHHMQFLAGCIENGRTEQALGYIRSVCSEIEAGKVTAYCENEAANLIFSAFADRAAKAGVQFTVQAGISQALPVSESDLCVLLSNALENALHAAVRCREAGQGAFIETTGHEKGKKLFLQITNSCLPDVQFREGVPVTDRTGHGLGVRSICAISERYGGLTSFAAKDGQFTLRVML